jgi:ferrous iron transport protein A
MISKRKREHMVSDQWIPLTALTTGKVAIVRRLAGGQGFVGRLASLGFTPGVPIQMLQNIGRGPLITRVRNTRVALGRGEAMKIWVSQEGGADG